MGRENKPLKFEDLLWFLVIILVQVDQRAVSWPKFLTLIQFLSEILMTTTIASAGSFWRPCEDEGRPMNVVMVPCLLQAAAVCNDDFYLLTKCITLCSFPGRILVFLSLIVANVTDVNFRSRDCLLFALIWSICDAYLSRNHRGILTRGEFGVLLSGSTIVVFEWIQKTFVSGPTAAVSHSSVALWGVMGCAMTCCLLISLQFPWWARLPLHVMVPLTVIESSLRWNGYSSTSHNYIPRSLNWLWEFLMSSENGYPRYWGLLYWAVVLVISSIPTSMVLGSKSEKLSVVIRRKWFHFLAVVLFGPTTYILPQLLSLSYAIALCVLVVAENLRPDIPFLQSFYLNFVDPAKDNPALIVSHMFLILGCAGPLWIAEWVFDDSLQYPLLSQWGVLCLGVGDAAGAVVGSFFGRHRWGQNRRTIEGSFAMWISVMGIGIVAFSDENWHALAVAATVTTLMEAFTLQMDNLVLPLVGATMILLQS